MRASGKWNCCIKRPLRHIWSVRTAVLAVKKQDIRKAKDYIEKHYRENLTLGVLAEKSI